VNTEGRRVVIRPTRHALARVSVLRGSGVQEGTAFIDDWIALPADQVQPMACVFSSTNGLCFPDPV
jgi:hypothetical protein